MQQLIVLNLSMLPHSRPLLAPVLAVCKMEGTLSFFFCMLQVIKN